MDGEEEVAQGSMPHHPKARRRRSSSSSSSRRSEERSGVAAAAAYGMPRDPTPTPTPTPTPRAITCHPALAPRNTALLCSGRIEQDKQFDSTVNASSLSSVILALPERLGDALHQQLFEVVRQREHLQNMELEIRAQYIACSKVLRIQSEFEGQNKKTVSIIANLRDDVQEREMRMRELEQRFDEKERQLHANRQEASKAMSQVWAKDGFLHEQNNGLASLRQERDNAVAERKAAVEQFEAEIAQLLAEVQDLKDQIWDKEQQFQEIDEQYHNIQEMLKYKDGQLRDAHAWIQQAQGLHAFHVNTANCLHTELRDRTEQIKQLCLNYQRQLAEVECNHAQALQKLKAEITEMREQNHMLGSAVAVESIDDGTPNVYSKDLLQYESPDQADFSISKVSAMGASLNNHSKSKSGVTEGAHTMILQDEISSKAEYAPGVLLAKNHILGVSPGLASDPATIMHPFGFQSGLASDMQPALGSQQIPTMIPSQHQQAKMNGHQKALQQSLHQTGAEVDQSLHSSVITKLSQILLEGQIDHRYSSCKCSSNGDCQVLVSEMEIHPSQLLNGSASLGATPMNSHESLEHLQFGNDANCKVVEPTLMDEKSLLACFVRAIPSEPSTRIQISTTLPNRLGKMLAPLHWQDYERQYGRLNDFVGSHPELFVVEGDSVHLREGAHSIVCTTNAIARVAAAMATASWAESSPLAPVAVTPLFQSPIQRVKSLKSVLPRVDAKQANSPQNTSDSPPSVVEDRKIVNNHSISISSSVGVKHDGITSTTNGFHLEKKLVHTYENASLLNGINDSCFANRQPGS